MKKIISKAATLLEALPYIQRFRSQIFVVKYGGSFMDSPDPEERHRVARDVVFLEAVGINVGTTPLAILLGWRWGAAGAAIQRAGPIEALGLYLEHQKVDADRRATGVEYLEGARLYRAHTPPSDEAGAKALLLLLGGARARAVLTEKGMEAP